MKYAFILSGAGIGGGSLVHTNTLMIPHNDFFKNKLWAAFSDWKKELQPFYEKAGFMLAAPNSNNKIPKTKFCTRWPKIWESRLHSGLPRKLK